MTPSPKSAGTHRPIASVDWNVILTDCDRWLRTVIFSRLRDGHATDEVMQEVALAAVRQAAPLRNHEKAAPWLYRLAVRQVLLYRRKKGRQRKLTDGYVARQAAEGSTDFSSLHDRTDKPSEFGPAGFSAVRFCRRTKLSPRSAGNEETSSDSSFSSTVNS